MHASFATHVRDRSGSFYHLYQLAHACDLNVARISYNQHVDRHTIVIQVVGDAADIAAFKEHLIAESLLFVPTDDQHTVVIDCLLPDTPGALGPILALLERSALNITYMSGRSDNLTEEECSYFAAHEGLDDIHDDYFPSLQRVRLGIHLNSDTTAESTYEQFLVEVARIACVREVTDERFLLSTDVSSFYAHFVREIARLLPLSFDERMGLLVASNELADRLALSDTDLYQTFDYIRQFAAGLARFAGEAYHCRVTSFELTGEHTLVVIEPPVGSNIACLTTPDGCIIVDGGFSRYARETIQVLQHEIAQFDVSRAIQLLTHSDVDHVGLIPFVSTTYVSHACAENFERERAGVGNWREHNPAHTSYVEISKILAQYSTPSPDKITSIDTEYSPRNAWFDYVGQVTHAGCVFETYVGRGGHVRGETVFVERELHVVFSGDILINPHDQIPEQHEFNMLAPYLMTSVDTDPASARAERAALLELLGPGRWLVIGGHGAAFWRDI